MPSNPNIKNKKIYFLTIPLVIAGVGAMWIHPSLFDFLERKVIQNEYGMEAWESGLRVIDNKGNLSDGSALSGSNEFILYVGSFILTVPIFLLTGIGLSIIFMKILNISYKEIKEIAESAYGRSLK